MERSCLSEIALVRRISTFSIGDRCPVSRSRDRETRPHPDAEKEFAVSAMVLFVVGLLGLFSPVGVVFPSREKKKEWSLCPSRISKGNSGQVACFLSWE
jgi:hypothetical protein